MNGGISNTGTIENGIAIKNQEAGEDSAYSSSGNGKLTGGLTISGTVNSASTTAAIVIGDGINENTEAIDTITVSGTLSSTGTDSTDSSGTAIFIQDQTTVTGTITNTGTINGDIKNAGTIKGGINSSGGIINGTIINSGDITGGVSTGGGAATSQVYLGKSGSDLDGGFEVTSGRVSSLTEHAIEIESGGDVDKITVSGGTLSTAAADTNAIHLNDGANLGNGDETATVIEVGDAGTIDAQGTGIYIGTNLTGKIAIAGTLRGESSITVASGKTYTGTIEVSKAVEDKILIEGTHATTNNASAIHITSSGKLGTTDSNRTIVDISGSLNSAIYNEGQITGDIVVTGAHSASGGTVYSSIGRGSSDSDKAKMDGSYKVSGSANVTSAGDTIVLNEYSYLKSVDVDTGATLTSTGTGRESSAIYVASNAELGGVVIDGELSSTYGPAIESEGTISGDIEVNGTVTGAGKGAVYLHGDGAFNGSIITSGAITGGVYLDQNQIVADANKNAILINSDGTLDELIVLEDMTTGDVSAIKIDSGSLEKLNIQGTVTSTNNDNAIEVEDGGTLGAIENSGKISKDIKISGNHTSSSASLYHSVKGSAKRYFVDGGTASSTGYNAIHLGAGASMDSIVVGGSGENDSGILKSTGGSAVYLDSGSTLDSIEINNYGKIESVDGTGIVLNGNNTDVIVNNGGEITGKKSAIAINGNNSSVTVNFGGEISGTDAAIVISGNSDSAITNSGEISADILIKDSVTYSGVLTNHFVISGIVNEGTYNSGLANNSSGDITTITNNNSWTGNINNSGNIEEIKNTGVFSGIISNTGEISNINLGGTSGTQTVFLSNDTTADVTGAIRIIDGGNIGAAATSDTISIASGSVNQIVVEKGGELDNSGSANTINVNGSLGSIDNRGTINGKVLINASQNSGNVSAYSSQGSDTHTATLDGTYQISGNSTVTSATDTIHVGSEATMATLTIDSGSRLETSDTDSSAIKVDKYGTLKQINNSGTILGGIEVSGSHSNSGSALVNSGTLMGGYVVKGDGAAGSTDDHGIVISSGGHIDKIAVEAKGTDDEDFGTLSTGGAGKNAVHIESGGFLYGLEIDGNLLGAGNEEDDSDDIKKKTAALYVSEGGNLSGNIVVGDTGLVSGGTGSAYSIIVDGTVSGSIVNSGDIAESIYIQNGSQTATNNHAILTKAGGETNSIILEGNLTGGTGMNAVHVESGGTLGTITNVAKISGGIKISGLHTSSASSVYQSAGSNSELDSYTIKNGGQAYSSGGNTINLGSNSELETLVVEVGGTLTNKSTGSDNNHAIYIGGSEADGARLGSDGATALLVSGTLSSDNGNAVFVDGSLRGTIQNNGLIEGGITINSPETLVSDQFYGGHTNTQRIYYAENAELDGGFNVAANASAGVVDTGNENSHTIHTGNNAITDSINVAAGGQLFNQAEGFSAVYVGSGGKLGTSQSSTMMLIEGQVFSAELEDASVAQDSAILIDSDAIAVGSLEIGNHGLVDGSVDQGAIAIKGIYQGTIKNKGQVSGGIVISGSHVATEQIVYAESNEIDSYKVSAGAVAGSTENHAIHLAGGNVKSIVVDGATSDLTAGRLIVEADGSSAIYVSSDSTFETINVNGLVISDSGHAIEIADAVESDRTGTIYVGTGGQVASNSSSYSSIHISGDYQGYINSSGQISSGILVTGIYAAADSSGVDDAIHLASGSTTSQIKISGSGAKLAANDSSYSAIHVADGATLGNSSTSPAILVEDSALLDNKDGAAIRVEGFVTGVVEVGAASLGSIPENVVIDFTDSDSALYLKHNSNSSVTRGSIVGSSFNDTLIMEKGSFVGNTIDDVEKLIISDKAEIEIKDNFELPAEIRVSLTDEFASHFNEEKTEPFEPFITVGKTVSASEDGSVISFRPDSIEAYESTVNAKNERTYYDEPETRAIGTEISVFSAQFKNPDLILVDADEIEKGTLEKLSFESASALIDVNVSDNGDGNITITLEPNPDIEKDGVLSHALSVVLDNQKSDDPEDQDQVKKLFEVLNQANRETVASYAEERKRDAGGYLQMASREVALSSQNIVFDRMTSLRSGFNFGDSFGLGSGGDDEPLESRSDEGFGQKIDFLNRGGVWGQMMYLEGSQDKKGNEDGFKNRAGGFVLGIDGQFREHYRLGIAGTYGYGDVNTTGGRSIASHHFLGTLYGSWEQDRYFIDSMFTYGSARNESKDETGKVYRDNRQWNLRMTGGARLPLGTSWEFVPMAEMNYGKVNFDAFRTTQQGIPGTLEFQDYSALELGLGFTINGLVQRGEIVTRPDFMLMAHRDLNTSGVKGKFTYLLGGAPLTITSVDRDYERYHAGLGLNFYMANDWTIRTGYDYRWSKTYRSHSFNAKFRYEF